MSSAQNAKSNEEILPEQSPPPSEVHESTDSPVETSSSDQETDPEISFHPTSPTHPAFHHNVPTMFMPYIEGPKMTWTMDDGLYHRFLKWHLNVRPF